MEDNVFSPNVTFCNDKYPKLKKSLKEFLKIIIKKRRKHWYHRYRFIGCNCGGIVTKNIAVNTAYYCKIISK